MSEVTVGGVMEAVKASLPEAPSGDTVDTIKEGSAETPVTGIVTTFLSTARILQFAAEQGANLVITHEPVYYNHQDETDWISRSAVYREKLELAREHGIVIWRCHDYAHAMEPDIIQEGVIAALGWEKYRMVSTEVPTFDFPQRPRPTALANDIKSGLATSRVLFAGDPDARCRRVVLMVGAPGGRHQLSAAMAEDVDALIAGEVNEWEAPEYFRDAAFQKRPKALLVVGHEPSEEAGMARLADWLSERFPDLPILHRSSGDPLRII